MRMTRCSICGELMMDVFGDVCDKCQGRKVSDSEKVLNFIRSHPNAKVAEISDGTGLSGSIVLEMIRKGKLLKTSSSVCSRCGCKFSGSGRFCSNCLT